MKIDLSDSIKKQMIDRIPYYLYKGELNTEDKAMIRIIMKQLDREKDKEIYCKLRNLV